MNFRNKFIYGLAQFSSAYGAFQNRNSIKNTKILSKFIIKNKLKWFDTSINYKNANIKASQLKIFQKNSQVITKISINNIEKKIIEDYKENLITLKNKFKINKFYAVLIHDPWNISKENFQNINLLFKEIIQCGIAKKVGISVYTMQEFFKFNKFVKINIAQIPLSIVDNRFVKKKFINYIKKNSIEVHARSIFLQGFLLNKTKKKLPIFFKKHQGILNEIENIAKKLKLNRESILVNYVFNYKFINKIVVGFNSTEELYSFLNIKKANFSNRSIKFKTKLNRRILDPRLWPKKI